jgi:hypothetical protein
VVGKLLENLQVPDQAHVSFKLQSIGKLGKQRDLLLVGL